MVITTTNDIPGKNIEVLGLAKGNVVQAKHIGKDFMAGLKNVVGGEVVSYTEMLVEAREIATQRMVADAEKMGADAIVMARYSSSQIMQSAAEIIAYGTAVKFI